MKRQRILIIIHLHITMVFDDGFPYTFYPEAMPLLIGFMGGQAVLGIREGIFPAGIHDGYYDKGRTLPSSCSDFKKGFRNAAGSFNRIVQQIAEQ